MLVDHLHYLFKLETGRVDSADREDFKPWEIDEYLNMGIRAFCKERFGYTGKIKRGFETDTVRIQQLSSLHVKSPELQPSVTPIEIEDGLYEVRLNDLGNDIGDQYFRPMFLTKAEIQAIDSNNCVKNMRVTSFQSDDAYTIYTDASWKWGRVNYNFGKSTYQHPHHRPAGRTDDPDEGIVLETPTRFNNDELISIFFDTRDRDGVKQFSINEAYLSYVKYPNRVYIGGYDHIDKMSKEQSPKIHCDIDEVFCDEIVRKAARFANKHIIADYNAQLQDEIRDLEY